MNKSLSTSAIVIVGLARNCAKVIEREVRIINAAFAQARTLNWLVIESDSDDETLRALQSLSANTNFEFITLGQLRTQFPKRTERIAVCRNRYLHELRTNKKYNCVDYVVVVDLDGVNTKLTAVAVNSCWKTPFAWDACFANQSHVYYDMWALRHELWCPSDCWQEYRFLLDCGINKLGALYASVYCRMIRIDPDGDALEVESAFGGLGIYKAHAILPAMYVGTYKNGDELCEHVGLHKTMRDLGSKLYIVPSLLNGSQTEYLNNFRLGSHIRTRLHHLLIRVFTFFKRKTNLAVYCKSEEEVR